METNWRQAYLRALPGVDAVVSAVKKTMGTAYPHWLLVKISQKCIHKLRHRILQAAHASDLDGLELVPEAVAEQVEQELAGLVQPSLRRVINATGTVLHTNLGRARLAKAAIEAMQEAAGYCSLELELASGHRGSRHVHVEKLLALLTGAEAACVVNNNAAAVLLALNTLAAGKKVIVSRGELVEIGGSFRIPEVMLASGAQLVEVGTTNKTRPRDYQQAIDEETALLLKVHTSNYRVVGFTESVEVAELVKIAREANIPVMEDLGSGLFIDLSAFGLEKEPLVRESLAAGVDVLTLSGDKLLGGPQAGIIIGKRRFIEQIKKNQLLRALRPDKVTLAALEATLRIYLLGEPLKEIPVLAMLTMPLATLQRRAEALAKKIREHTQNLDVVVREDVSYVGGGAMPLTQLPTYVVALRPRQQSLAQWVEMLRLGEPSLVGRVQEGWLLLDPRTIAEAEEEEVVKCLI